MAVSETICPHRHSGCHVHPTSGRLSRPLLTSASPRIGSQIHGAVCLESPPTPARATCQHCDPWCLGTADLRHARSHLPLTGTQPAPGRGHAFKTHKQYSSHKVTPSGAERDAQDRSTVTLRMNRWAAKWALTCSPGTEDRGWWCRVPRSQPAAQGIHGHLTGTLPSGCGSTEGLTEGTHLRVNTRRVLRGATRPGELSGVPSEELTRRQAISWRGGPGLPLEGSVD